MRLSGYSFILIAATLWATLGVFYQGLIANYQISPLTIVFSRSLIAALVLFIAIGITNRKQLQLKKHDWLFFICFGLIGVTAFFYIYIYAITLNGIGVAAVMLYTAPIWVTLYSVLIFHERIELRLGIALLLAVTGVALVSQIYSQSSNNLTPIGILAGLVAGIGYASYILFNKSALLRNYQPWTVNAYALAIGTLLMIPLQPWQEFTRPFAVPPALFWLFVLGIVPTLGGSLAFNLGLQRIPASNASIVATLEPLIAILLGRVFFAEQLAPLQILGGICIVFSVIILQTTQKS